MVGSHDGQRIQIHYIMGGNRLFFKWAKPDLYFGFLVIFYKIVGFSRIWTEIEEGENADNFLCFEFIHLISILL